VHSDTQGVSITTDDDLIHFQNYSRILKKNHSTTKKAGKHRGQAVPADWNRIETRRKANKTRRHHSRAVAKA
jgi:hypothetical protein